MASCGLQDILIFHGMDEKLSINPTVRMTWPVSTMTMFLGFARHKITPSVATTMPPKRAELAPMHRIGLAFYQERFQSTLP